MSGMSAPRLGKSQRLSKIKELYPLHRTVEQIAAVCGVNEKTIRRDIKEWKQGGGFEEWLLEEFYSLHGSVKLNEEKVGLAYSTIAQLLGKTLTQKSEQRTNFTGKETIEIKIIEDAFESGNEPPKEQ